jgi:isopentenyl diphosphate isomerase/L-lactate dehydrogenase-like FMN-dependent dehydrogenase
MALQGCRVALLEIVEAVDGKLEELIDAGIRRGTDTTNLQS